MTGKNVSDVGVSRRLIPVTQAMRDLIAERMQALGINGYRTLADRTGDELSHASTHRILTGRQAHVRPRTIEVLAEALDISPAELLNATTAVSVPWTLGADFDQVPIEARPNIERGLKRLLEAAGLL